MPLSTTNTTIIFYTCHYLPPTPLSYSIHVTIYHQHHYHILYMPLSTTNTTIILYALTQISSTPPQAGLKISSIASLLVSLSNCFLCSPFVSTSANCSPVGR
ncbi:hypothetical protein CsSME_00012120 [Camellia sinensis var. sinensis]